MSWIGYVLWTIPSISAALGKICTSHHEFAGKLLQIHFALSSVTPVVTLIGLNYFLYLFTEPVYKKTRARKSDAHVVTSSLALFGILSSCKTGDFGGRTSQNNI